VALIPTRYPGSESSADGLIVLARKTLWEEAGENTYHGIGQRMIATDTGETPLMDIRLIAIDGGAGPTGESTSPERG
jgi:type VI secretion system protein ImpE